MHFHFFFTVKCNSKLNSITCMHICLCCKHSLKTTFIFMQLCSYSLVNICMRMHKCNQMNVYTNACVCMYFSRILFFYASFAKYELYGVYYINSYMYLSTYYTYIFIFIFIHIYCIYLHLPTRHLLRSTLHQAVLQFISAKAHTLC